MEKYFGTFEAAKICRVTPASIIRWIKEGKLKASVTIGGHHRISATDLLHLIRGLQIQPPSFLTAQEEEVRRVLIVDDENAIRSVIRTALKKKIKQIHIEEASDGFEAGMLISKIKPHLVILDLMLPGMDGFKVAKFIRNDGPLPKIIAISGYSDTRNEIIKCGADDFILKPFDLDDLTERVLRHLQIPAEYYRKLAS